MIGTHTMSCMGCEGQTSVLLCAVAPPPPTGVSVASCTGGDSVALVWEEPTDTTVTNYTLRATPPVENCDPTCSTVGREYVFTGLLPEQSYELSVQGINCGDQTGGESTFNVTIPSKIWCSVAD